MKETTIPIKLENPGTMEPLHIPANCTQCGFPNFNIHGVKQDHTLTIKVKCMRCRKPHQKITHT
jgi:hypothetical protein